jgi:hypothetical protein
MLIEEIDGMTPALHVMAPFLAEAGFIAGALGMQAILRNRQSSVPSGLSDITSRQPAGARRPSKSSVSSPFAVRNFEPGRDEETS